MRSLCEHRGSSKIVATVHTSVRNNQCAETFQGQSALTGERRADLARGDDDGRCRRGRVDEGARAPSAAPGSRFSLLHLDEGEDYVVDFAGSLKAPPGVLPAASDPMATPSRQNGKLRGRIRLLTRSLAFEPDDPAVAVLKFPLKHVVRLDPVGSLGFDVHSHRVLHIRPMGEDVPYHIDDDRSHPPWRFDLIHDDVAKVLEPAAALLRVSRAPHAKAEETLAAMRRRREERRAFDRSRLRRPDETILFDAPAAQITPLVREPGRLVVTDARAYFQPTWDLACVGVRCLAASDVVAVARRRHTLRPLAVEVFSTKPTAKNAREGSRAPQRSSRSARKRRGSRACAR